MATGLSKRPAAASSRHRSTSLVRGAVKRAKNAVVRYATEHASARDSQSSTLIVAMACDRLITAAQMGDGAVITFDSDGGAAKTLCAAHPGEYANETTFIRTPRASWEPIVEYYARRAAQTTEQEQDRELRVDDRVRMARNLALRFRAVHAAGYVIGDVHEKNVQVNRQNSIAMAY